MKKSEFIYVNPFNRAALREAVISDICTGVAGFNCALTLTFPYKKINRSEAQKRCLHFRNIYNKVFGYGVNHRRASKYDKKASAPFAAFIEGGYGTKRLHYHIALHKPVNLSLERYKLMIALMWYEALNDESAHLEVKEIYSDGWVEYITKEFFSGNADALDELNYNVF